MGLTVEERELAVAAAREILARRARLDSAAFVEGFFGYRNAPFHREWHDRWNQPSAHVVQWSPISHGKTQQITGWALWRLGSDPERVRILWVSAAQTTGLKSTGIIKQAIENPTPFLRAVFPKLQRGPAKWTQAQFSVKGAKVTEKDYSVETAGLDSAILGGRYTDIVLDDICTEQTTYTAAQRQAVIRWLFSTILGRLLEGGRVICVGNAWYPDDVMHALAQRGFTVIRNEAYREAQDGTVIPGSILWPEQWSLDRLGNTPTSDRRDGSMSKRKELATIESMRQLRCMPYSPGQGRFKMEWFDKALEAGQGLTLVDEYRGPWPTFAGFDIGISQKEGADKTAGWCMAVDPKTQRRLLLNGFEGRLTGGEIVARLKAWSKNYGAVIMVENNAAQDHIRQWAKDEHGIATRAFTTTGLNKNDVAYGVPSLGVELEQGMWILPSGNEAARALATTWRTQCLAYTPGQHTGDLLMASWFAREAARGGDVQSHVGAAASIAPTGQGPSKVRYGDSGGLLFRK